MRLTVLCVCGTLVAFLSLSRTRAEEGIPLEDRGFGPCLATFRPVGACKPGEHDSTCPYHISLPPLDVHLPLHFLGLENIMQDLQNLKDSVDELREMCADCTGGRAGRNCGKQSERELKGEPSSPSPRELRVKINQVAAFVNNSLIPKVGQEGLPKERPEGSDGDRGTKRTDGKLSTSTAFKAIRDCSDHMLRGRSRSGVYMVTPDLRSSSFQVYCDMELDGGGWTLLQRRQDGRVSFNRTWVEYRAGFGVLDGGDFWLGNNKIHPLTRDRDMELRVELEDFQGVTGHAQYEYFRVASERLRYRLTVGGYSGTAGDALRFSKTYDHNNRAFTTPDRDNDRYPSGNCGAYYSSGWWFDACMAANLNGRYYTAGRYKGVRDGIFWGTWHNISSEYYPTNERQSFKSVRMMIRPKSFGSH
ncbi:PREDICTED: fibroleukin-like isoform X3 [Cyprinodon variegatus]|uniref:fibroleukin-like isoform X3 n=1 Tax=Cyprinodon variegatus TaxID=28743 RepID=UPI000742C876|nr:PREDICTED: fibroleukin-like isoform X3 [Cyprinodon variegatus]